MLHASSMQITLLDLPSTPGSTCLRTCVHQTRTGRCMAGGQCNLTGTACVSSMFNSAQLTWDMPAHHLHCAAAVLCLLQVTASTSRPLAAGGDDGDMPLPPPPRSLKGGAIGSTPAAAGDGSSRGGPPPSAARGGAGPGSRQQQQQQQLGEQIGEPISIVESDEEEDGFTIPGDDAIR